ncbi:F-box/kelch-repeat protein At3g23880-like [Ziziphus jujuba]|uniref:F-box/kelch-repeat protein At3g23880-like n=1 Tax=Ziziphus jujuba TaxID=326968 RepID=A0A6P4ANS2_ZIZJJ|nr:F-box/kelch-repeat protein At3g23880-like [Ziziphus jujuba]
MLCDIPEEVLEEHVLWRLSVKTLVKLGFACKSLNAIVTAPRFISKHADWSAKNQPGYLINHGGCEITRLDKRFDFIEKLDFPFKHFKFQLVGACHGLLCLTKEFRPKKEKFPTTFIWNPSIRLVKEILPPDIITSDPYYITYKNCVSGFGFDCTTNDYKVFHILLAKFSKQNHDVDHVVINLVHSLNADSWRVIENDTNADDESTYPTICTGCTTSFNGSFYWIPSKKYESSPELIKWFDFCDEKIRKTRLPRAVVKNDQYVVCIGSLKNSLVVFVSDDEQKNNFQCRISAWVMMKELGQTTTWVHQFSVPNDPQVGLPLDIGLDGETLCWKFQDSMENSKCFSYSIVVYDDVKQRKSIREVDTHIVEDSDVDKHIRVRETFTYSESLLLLGLRKGVGINRY